MGTKGLVWFGFSFLCVLVFGSLLLLSSRCYGVVWYGMNGMGRIMGLTMMSSTRCDSEECKQNINSLHFGFK